MKTSVLKIMSVLVAVLYVMSLVGFDIHCDHHDGNVYVVSLLRGISCESIHPGDVCRCCHHEGDCHDGCGDCTDDILILSLAGEGTDVQVCCPAPASEVVPADAAPHPALFPLCRDIPPCAAACAPEAPPGRLFVLRV